jgi:hypothetical protein
METTIDKNTLIIRIPLTTPTPSKSGKTLLVAGTGGFVATTAQVNGQTVSLSINATIPAK